MLEGLLTGRSSDAQRLFYLYDHDRDGLLAHEELRKGMEAWGLQLCPETFKQFVDCNFIYADKDSDGLLNLADWTKLFKLLSKVLVRWLPTKHSLHKDSCVSKKQPAAVLLS